HTSMTDHRVVRRPKPPDPKSRGNVSRAAANLVIFQQSSTASRDLELQRDCAVAAIDKAANANNVAVAKEAVGKFVPALEKWPHDIGGLRGLELGYYLMGKKKESLETSERILRLDPKQEKTLQNAMNAAFELGRLPQGRDYARRLVEINPGNAEYH